MNYILSYASGVVGRISKDTFAEALEEAIYRCNGLVTDAKLLDSDTYKVLAVIEWTTDGAKVIA